MSKGGEQIDPVLLRQILDATSDLILVHPALGDASYAPFLLANRSACERLGYSLDELRTRTILDISNHSVADDIRVSEALRRDGEVTFERTLVSRSGEEIPTEIRTRVLEVAGQRVAVSVARDIADRRRAVGALQEAETRLRRLTEHLPGIVFQFRLEADGRVVSPYVSAGTDEILGLTPVQVMAQPQSLLERVHPEDLNDVRQALELCREGPLGFHMEGRVVSRTGRLTWLDVHATPLHPSGGGIVWNGVALDVTPRKEAEEAARQGAHLLNGILEQSPVGMALFHPDGSVEEVNPAMVRLLGLSDQALRLFNERYNLVRLSDPGRTGMSKEAALAFQGEAVFLEPYLLDIRPGLWDLGIPTDGVKPRWVRTYLYPVRGRDGELRRVILVHEDVSREMEGLQERARLQSRFRAFLEQSPLGVALFDPEGTLVDTNRAFVKLMGLEEVADRIIGRYNRLHSEWMRERGFEDPIRRAFLGERVVLGPYQTESDSILGGLRLRVEHPRAPWVRAHYYPLRADGGELEGVAVVYEDVTAQVRAAEERAQAEHRFRAFMEQSPIGIALFDADGTLLEINRSLLETFGLEGMGDSMVGRVNIRESRWLRSHRYAEALDRVFAGEAFVLEAHSGGAEELLAEAGIDAQPKRPWVQTHYYPLRGTDGSLEGVALVVEDITAAREAAEELRLLKEAVDGFRFGVSISTPTGTGVYANQAYLALVGCDEATWRGEPMERFWTDVAARERWRTALVREGYVEGESLLRRLDGALVPVDASCVVLEDHRGEPVLFATAVTDITERRAAEARLAESESRLRALAVRLQEVREDERSMLARELHDQVGQALTALALDLARLREETGSELADTITDMEGLVDETLGLVQDLTGQLRPPILDQLGLVPAIRWQLEEFARRTGLNLRLFTPRRLDLEDLDAGAALALFRVFQEAVTNVIRHANARSVAVRLERERGGGLMLEVADDGVGITHLERWAPDSLGLLGMRERMTALRGTLEIHAPPEGGTRVVARVPEHGPQSEPTS